jgi:predicted nucleic acid-binding protein
MLYLDSSALVKRYVQEKGSNAVVSRFEREETIYTSVLSFAEVHAAIGRKYRDKQLNANEKKMLVDDFHADWLFSLTVLELTIHTMTALPTLCERYFLKASDAVQVSTAIWLNDSVRLRAKGFEGSRGMVEFGVADKRLSEIASRCGLQIFNPEDEG